MKRILLTIIVVIIAFGSGYWIGQLKPFADGVVADIGKYELNDDAGKLDLGSEDFDVFIYKFISDSLFQMDRIKFPLKSSRQIDIETADTTSIKKADWEIHRLFWNDEYKAQLYDNFDRELRYTDERLFCWEGIENGIYVEYKFKRILDLWYLIEYNDFSD